MLIDRSSSSSFSICDVVLRVSHKTCLPPNCIKSWSRKTRRTLYIFCSEKDNDCRCLFFHHLYLFTIFWVASQAISVLFLSVYATFARLARTSLPPKPPSAEKIFSRHQGNWLASFSPLFKLHHFLASKVEPQTITNLCLFFQARKIISGYL